MRTSFIKILLIFSPFLASAQTHTVLDEHIEQGLANNLVLQQKDISLEKALHSLKIANGMFAPSVNFIGNYTNGDGGRAIAIPIGDLLNGVYSTLNQLTNTTSFPQIENVNENFFPRNFYDVRARASMPLVNSDLVFNKRLQAHQLQLQEFEVIIYKRELVRNIKTSYFNYLSAKEAEKIYASALTRALEGKRVNESLLANGKSVPAYLLRSESEIETIKAQQTEAEQQAHNAQLYFNFLLNREPETEINTNYNISIDHIPSALQTAATATAREELLQLQTGIEANATLLKMKQSFWVPRLSAFADFGAQAQDLKYNSDANYYLLGAQLDVPIFAGFTNRHKILQAKLDVKNTELSRSLINQQLHMSSTIATNSLRSVYQNYLSAQKQLEAAQSYQRLILKGYSEGVSTFIETVDARNQLTAAQLVLTINQYKVLIAEANVERETAAYTFK
jgi:outer membrane protein